MQRWILFTDDELYAILNSVIFSRAELERRGNGIALGASDSKHWRDQAAILTATRHELEYVLKEREGK